MVLFATVIDLLALPLLHLSAKQSRVAKAMNDDGQGSGVKVTREQLTVVVEEMARLH